jgi:VanZ family protein
LSPDANREPPPLAPLAAAALLLVPMLVVTVPSSPKFWIVLSNAAHAPVFAAISLLVFQALRARPSPGFRRLVAMAFFAAVALGLAVEVVQGFIGRDSSWGDVGTDALGAAAALGWITYRSQPASRRIRLAGLGVAVSSAVLVAAPLANAGVAYGLRAMQLPVIAGFSLPWDLYFTEFQSASARRMSLPSEWSRPGDPTSLELVTRDGEWPGVSLTEPAPDWRGYASLHVDLTNPGSNPLELTLRVHDALHDQRHEDRFNRRLKVASQSRTIVTIPLAEVESAPSMRRLDLGRVAGVILFATGESARPGTRFYVTRIWLE